MSGKKQDKKNTNSQSIIEPKASKGEQKFDPVPIEKKWQEKWEETKIYSPDLDTARKPFYNLMMFPYPSAEGLHVGSFFTYGGIDAYGRFKRMQGYDVFEPIGLDGFGIHSENYAIKVGRTPQEHAEISQKNFYRQLHILGNSFDWSRKLETYDPNYYKWTQWIFTELFKAGLAYKAEASVNFCPSCKTVLSDEQVISGACERCGSIVEKKMLSQWFFRITSYAEKLLANTEKLDWTEKVKIAQKNWIGKSTGAELEFGIKNLELRINVFTTRPDTLYGATFLVLSPEHPLIQNDEFRKQITDKKVISNYIERFKKESKNKKPVEKSADEKDKTGVDTGVKAVHPLTGEELPIWIADYVVMEYGTGAIMAVPGHDERDFAFAKKYGLPVKHVVMPSLIDTANPPQEGKEDTRRNVVMVIVKDPQSEKYLTLHWKKYPWKTFITGGVEEGEDVVTAARREIAEETGYTDLRFIRELGGPTEAFFYAAHKGVNRQTRTHILFFQLSSNAKIDVADSETNQFDMVWMTEEALLKASIRHSEFDLLWKRLQTENDAYNGEGVLINSNGWDGLCYPQDKDKIIRDLKKKGIGKAENRYHLRDWLISRQRYWGPPIPMIYCEHCAKEGKSWLDTEEARKYESIQDSRLKIQDSGMVGWYPVPVEQLPVKLPVVKDFIPLGTGKSPLANHPEFYETTCPRCGRKAVRETDVSDVFLDSAWYFFRYLATDWQNIPFPMDEEKAELFDTSHTKEASARMKYLPVTSYIGGAEHAVLHLLYSRFITMVLNGLGYINFDEPFTKFRANGLIIKDGAKMSKSKGNVINPDDYVKKYGADTLRTYLMFLGPFSEGGDFQDSGIEGINKFLKRVWTLFTTRRIISKNDGKSASSVSSHEIAELHKTIKGVTEDLEDLRYNTAIAKLMTYYHVLTNQKELEKEQVRVFLQMLAPFAPYMTEELWERMGESYSIHTSSWPRYDKNLIIEEEVTIAVQVNGKLRGTITVNKEKMHDINAVISLAKENSSVAHHLHGKTMRREPIYIPGKIINFIVA